jgi:hypothetical protein
MADLSKIIQAAAEAALDDGSQNRKEQASEKVKRKGLSMPRSLLVGAALFTAGRVLVRVSGRDLVEGLQQRLEDFEAQFPTEDDDEPEDEYEDEGEPEAEYDDEEEPEDEYEDEDEPEAEYDEEEEPEDDEEVEERPRSRRSASRASS